MTAFRKALALAVLTVALLTMPAPAAGAAEFGSDCSADQIAMSGFIMVPEQTEPGSPFPVAAPFAGILTSWTTRGDAFGAEPNVGYMKVLRPAEPAEFTGHRRIRRSELVGPGTAHPSGPDRGRSGRSSPRFSGPKVPFTATPTRRETWSGA